MKNQYVGDIGDYGKYGLLRFLSRKGIRIGVNWYLTEDDGTTDGKFTEYLKNNRENGFYQLDAELYKALQRIDVKGIGKKSVADIRESGIIPKAIFFEEPLKSFTVSERELWHEDAKSALLDKGRGLIFADPDNGTWNETREPPNRISKKHALISELRDYFDRGADIVYYCHKGRRKEEIWQEKMMEFNADGQHAAGILVLTYHRGTQRSYIFAVHSRNYAKYDALINEFLCSGWGSDRGMKKLPPFTREL